MLCWSNAPFFAAALAASVAVPNEFIVGAGEALYFTIAIVDKFGNRVEEVDATHLQFKVAGKPMEQVSTFRQDDGDLYTSVSFVKCGDVSLQVFYNDPEATGSREVCVHAFKEGCGRCGGVSGLSESTEKVLVAVGG